jgi:hypothetical protein
MTNVASTSAVKAGTSTETRQIVLKEIGAKWNKFSEQDLSALKNKDDVVTQVVAKYGIDTETDRRNSRVIIDACIPFRRKKTFPVIARSSKALDERIRAKWAKDLPKDF